MSVETHRARHEHLRDCADELGADYLRHHPDRHLELVSYQQVLDWAAKEAEDPTEPDPRDANHHHNGALLTVVRHDDDRDRAFERGRWERRRERPSPEMKAENPLDYPTLKALPTAIKSDIALALRVVSRNVRLEERDRAASILMTSFADHPGLKDALSLLLGTTTQST